MTLRESLDLVLRSHNAKRKCPLHVVEPYCDKLLAELLSCFCFPQPSREKLEKLWNDHHLIIGCKEANYYPDLMSALMCWATDNQEQPERPIPSLKTLERIFKIHDRKYSSKAEWLKAIQFDILRWANGNWSEPKVWCEHITWNGTHWQCGGYWLKQPDRYGWILCPICGAKRPSDANS